MRLLRISTEDPNAIFSTEFNTNITIEPNTQIALQSFIAKIANDEENLADNTILWNYGINTPTPNAVTIRNGVFGSDNYVELLDFIQLAMNDSFGNPNGDYPFQQEGDEWKLGRQMNVAVVNGKIAIQNKIAYNDNDVDSNFRNQGDVSVIPNGVISVIADPFTSESYLHNCRSYYPLASGTGYFRIQINTLQHDLGNTDPNLLKEGFMIGLTKRNLTNKNANQVLPEDVYFGIGVGYDQDASKFVIYYMDESVRPVNSNIEPESSSGAYNPNNSFVQLRIEGNQIHFEYSNEFLSVETLTSSNFDRALGEDYYPFIVLHGSEDYVELVNPEMTFDPYVYPKIENSVDVDDNFMPRWNGDTTTQMELSLIFASQLGKWLGYNVDNYFVNTKTIKRGSNFNFTAENIFKSGRTLLNMVLELVNMNVKSYDSESKQRRNILSTLLSADDERVIDTIPSLVFIDLDNKDRINLRNITMRLLDQDLNPVNLDGKATVTLLLKNIDEK